MYKEKRLRPIIITGCIILLIIIVISILGIAGVFNQNPFGQATKIDNFKTYFKQVPIEKYDAVTAALYTTIGYNLPAASIPTDGALIREGSVKNDYNEESLSTLSTFLVDIESIQQTYNIQMQWSDNPDATMAGYSMLVTCPAPEQLIYPEFTCEDMLTRDPASAFYIKYPFLNKLPIDVSEYNNNYTSYTHYTINYSIIGNYENVKFSINDYTGGNHERALSNLRELSVDLDKFEIEYHDDTEEEESGNAGEFL